MGKRITDPEERERNEHCGVCDTREWKVRGWDRIRKIWVCSECYQGVEKQ